eukprot:2858189-Prorocentrum_lima.AAC.1
MIRQVADHPQLRSLGIGTPRVSDDLYNVLQFFAIVSLYGDLKNVVAHLEENGKKKVTKEILRKVLGLPSYEVFEEIEANKNSK